MVLIDLMPSKLNRTKSQNRLDSDEARILENVDLSWMVGRMRRSAGIARSNFPVQTSVIASAGTFVRYDCSKGVIAHVGTSLIVVYGDASAPDCGGVAPFWVDNPTTPQLLVDGGIGENFNEERDPNVGVY